MRLHAGNKLFRLLLIELRKCGDDHLGTQRLNRNQVQTY